MDLKERKKIREEAETQTFSVDPAVRCQCDRCGNIHYVKNSGKAEKDTSHSIVRERPETEPAD